MSPAVRNRPVIFVLAGVNGAGKSSIGGELLRREGLDYFNPDEAAKRIRSEIGCSISEANSLAWNEGRRRLEAAIETHENFAFESTLGGSTIPALIREASEADFDVLVWFVGLSTPQKHIARVRARVASGGHDIPEATIMERWNTSRRNIIALMPHLAELRVFDNSADGDPRTGRIPAPRLLLHWKDGAVVSPAVTTLSKTPEWARPVIARALKLQRLHGG